MRLCLVSYGEEDDMGKNMVVMMGSFSLVEIKKWVKQGSFFASLLAIFGK